MDNKPKCLICGQTRRHLLPASMVRTSIVKLIHVDHPEWNDQSCICLDDLNLYRSRFVAEVLEEERGEITHLEEDVIRSLKEQVIMMSQNRQESKDRLRAENDYRVNLKAELEIRQLHSKLDMLLTHQWQRLLEIQQIQTELIQQITDREDPSDPRTSK